MRLLLAEDEKDLSDALVTVLKHNNYSVDAVYNGQDALEYLETDNYDAAILDIMMPKMDGITVLKTIRAAGSNLPILLLTARSEIDDRVNGLDNGADDYLTKPFSMKELLARIRAITRRQAQTTDSILQLGNLQLNRSTYQLSTEKACLFGCKGSDSLHPRTGIFHYFIRGEREMITKLRRKFIAIAICSIALVLFIIMAGINIASYLNVCKNADMRISLIADNDGKMPQNSKPDGEKSLTRPQDPDIAAKLKDGRRGLSPETAFDTRFLRSHFFLTDKFCRRTP